MRGGSEARVLGEGMMSLREDTLSGFKARSTGSLTAVGREIGMGLLRMGFAPFRPILGTKLVSTMLSRACTPRRIITIYSGNAGLGARELKMTDTNKI